MSDNKIKSKQQFFALDNKKDMKIIKELSKCKCLEFLLCGYTAPIEWDEPTGLSSFAGARDLSTKQITSTDNFNSISRGLYDEYIYVKPKNNCEIDYDCMNKCFENELHIIKK